MNQETLSEAVVVLVQCARSLAVDISGISRTLQSIERRGMSLSLGSPPDDVILTRLRSRVWPEEDRRHPVHNIMRARKSGALTHSSKSGTLSS